jgi:hypothetical protein
MPSLRQVSPYQIAQMIRDLDSQLIGIESKQDGDELILIYSFAVAGNVQQFQISVTTQPIASITDLYPAASAFEAQLQRQHGLVFQPSGDNA